jgi:hypothetical protein
MNEEKIQETKSKIQNDKFYNTHIMLENCQLAEPVEVRFYGPEKHKIVNFLCFSPEWDLHGRGPLPFGRHKIVTKSKISTVSGFLCH